MEAPESHQVVRHAHVSENPERLKIEVTENSKGFNVLVWYSGDDEEEVIETVARVMARTKSKLEEL